MALYVLLMALLVHLPRALETSGASVMGGAASELEMVNFFRNIMVTGALLAFAQYIAKDKRVIG